ncbi:glycoside hydrolase family 25 protein [Pontibacter locisalis]|uniref:Glycoside hydrolase family 25 protein n=1 Tax=Pontibacter locisalis TaxID=1719035 RepID=A0ABW5IKW6_9BACT
MKKVYKWILLCCLLGVCAAVVIVYLFIMKTAGVEIDKTMYPVTGIDVSNHTGKIDFAQVKEQGVDFVIIKATEGANFKDESFERNYSNAQNADIPVGAYHFFRFNRSGKEQAKNFLKHIKGKRFELPLVLDVEEWGNSGSSKREEVVAELQNFIDEVESQVKKKVMIYTNESGYRTYIKGNFDTKSIWICSFSKSPNIDAKWTLWQHSHIGKLKGAEGWIDLNTFNGSRAEWNNYLSAE